MYLKKSSLNFPYFDGFSQVPGVYTSYRHYEQYMQNPLIFDNTQSNHALPHNRFTQTS